MQNKAGIVSPQLYLKKSLLLCTDDWCLPLPWQEALQAQRDEGSQADRAPAIPPKFVQSPANKELQQSFLESKSLSRKWENRKERIANAVSRLLIITENGVKREV